MAVRAADQFAGLAAGRVRSAAEGRGQALARRGPRRRARGAHGRGRGSVRDVPFATPDVVSPERADAARALAELLGVHVVLRTAARKEEP